MSLEPLIHEPGAGQTLSLRGTQIRILSTAAHSAGASTFEFVAAPGWDTGSHLHGTVAEQFFVLDGEMEIRAGDQLLAAQPGTFVNIPAGVVHAFANRRSAAARMLLVCTPPGHERYFADLAAIVARDAKPDPEEIAGLRARYDTTQVSPLTT